MKTNNLYNQITNEIVKQLEAGIVPWQKPWQNGTFMGCVSHTSGKPYSLLNQWLLNYRSGEYLTYKQIQAEGGKVKAGEKANIVVFWQFVEKIEKREVIEETDDCGEVIGTETKDHIKRYPILKSYHVFHIDQCEGIKPKFNNAAKVNEHEPIEVADEIIKEYVEREGLKLEIKNTDRAFYMPIADRVEVPELAQYEVKEEFYSTLFHELTHSTGHAKRLNRDTLTKLAAFGDETYSKEELVAEIGAAFVCQMVGIDCEKAFTNSVAYIQGWLRALKGDNKLVIAAAAKAEQAANYIINGKK